MINETQRCIQTIGKDAFASTEQIDKVCCEKICVSACAGYEMTDRHDHGGVL